jgi:hypothetical protein
MNKIISCCGINCEQCDARIATLANDDALRAKTAETWGQMFNANIKAADINCAGCREDGVKFSHCMMCEIKKCAEAKNFATCGDCSEIESCETIGYVLKNVPDALTNLKSLN